MSIAEVLKLLDREIWVVTASSGARHGGLVATWVTQASIDLERPTVAIALAMNHFTRSLVDSSGAFAVHLLSREQVAVAIEFAIGSGRDRDKLEKFDFDLGETGSPILHRCLAWLECRVYDRYAAGDRVYFWADVLRERIVEPGSPLREKDFFAAITPEQRERLLRDMQTDIRLQRPLIAHWRDLLAPWSAE